MIFLYAIKPKILLKSYYLFVKEIQRCLVGGLTFGVSFRLTDVIPVIAALYGMESVAVGWIATCFTASRSHSSSRPQWFGRSPGTPKSSKFPRTTASSPEIRLLDTC